MGRVLVIDMVGDQQQAISQALAGAGWEVVVLQKPSEGCDKQAVAAVVATDAAGLSQVQRELARLRESCELPIILIADLDRSGWDRTFGSSGGLGVDALLTRPVDPKGLVHRLQGIVSAREAAQQLKASPNLNVVVKLAIANEEAAEAFYRSAAERVSDSVTRDALLGLMKDEQGHKRLLEEFREGRRSLPQASPAVASLMEAFGTPEFSADLAPADAFVLAANKERVAMRTYQDWAALYGEGPERELLLRLAEMEHTHLVRVEAIFANAAFPEVW